ncbi:hypothetical protein U9M48_043640 [Paspalum notatum var. saurae]|uniref:FBD domain-containing protein n=1 Tax=Paspalum notatum var. saurae TaxID=547442 RepID=A0AAQ3XHJ7_PASNO
MPQAVMAAFPCLETLQLRRSTVRTDYIQALIDAAPRLATMHLESVFFQGTYTTGLRLSCPTTTELVLELCGDDVRGQCPIEIDAPRLRYFRYKGSQRPFSLSSPAPDMARVDLHFLQDHGYDHLYDDQDHKDKTLLELFWKFVRNFTSTRLLKLKVNYLVDIAVVRETELLCTFRNAVRVELDGVHHATTKAASLAISNLLHCCPVVRDLRLKLRTTLHSDFIKGQPFLERKDRLDYDRSVNLFMSRPRLNPMFLDDSDVYDEVPGISGLGGHSFTCLQTSLTRVSLQFRMDNFTDNAQVLKEIYVDTGNWKLCEHMNLNVERWIAPTSSKARLKRRNLAESSWKFSKFARNSSNSRTELRGPATSFTVLPLQR